MVALKRSYSIDGTTKSSFSQSDVVKVTLTLNFQKMPLMAIMSYDILPQDYAMSTSNYFDQRWYPLERDRK